jgi:xanthine dehydrogenase accessory factor
MKALFETMRERLLRNESVVLVTLIAASGSTPREAGARMLAGGEGRIWGTIGGALPEHLAIEEAGGLMKRGGASLKTYILHENDAADIGAKCGGEMTVFLQYIDAAAAGLPAFIEAGIRRFSVNVGTWLIMNVTEGEGNELSLTLAAEDGPIASLGRRPADIPPLLPRNKCALLEQNGTRWFSQPLTEAGFVYVFGGGHVAQELVPLLARLDFRCVVFDDRVEFARPELFPGAAGVIQGAFDRIGNYINLGANDYAVIVTRGHRWDYETWAFALRSPAAYIGVIGSRSKHAFVRDRLRATGFSEAEIHAPRVHVPIGVAIGSKSPAEVAVSIAAELIKLRAGVRQAHPGGRGLSLSKAGYA